MSRSLHLCSSVFICGLCLLLSGCKPEAQRTVVLYTSIDQPVAAAIVREFEKQTGIRVTLVTDTEATKSVGLAERLRAEKSNPQADVRWGNEPLHTINLADEKLLVASGVAGESEAPAALRDPQGRWLANAIRVRVLATAGKRVARLDDLLDPKFRDKIAIARPTAGTTGGHVAALYVAWGDQRADEFFRQLRANGVNLLGGNGPVADAVGAAQVQIGLTDNDDVEAVRRNGAMIEMFLPDQDSLGTLAVPTTIALVAGRSGDRDAAKKLIAYLASREVEQKLIDVKFAYGSIRSPDVRIMDVDYTTVARKLPEAVRRATAILEGRE